MLKYLEISFDGNVSLTRKCQHIQFNLFEKIEKLKYIKLQRINVIYNLSTDEDNNFEILGAHDKICNLRCSISDPCLEFTRKVTLKTYEGLRQLFILKKWNVEDLEKAISESITDKFNVPIPYIKKKWSQDKAFYGEVKINYQPEFAEFIFVAYDKSKKPICEISILKVRLNPMLFRRFLNEAKWDGHNYVISDQEEEIGFFIDPVSCTIEIQYSPKFNSIEELKGYMRALHYQTVDNESNKLLGFPSSRE